MYHTVTTNIANSPSGQRLAKLACVKFKDWLIAF